MSDDSKYETALTTALAIIHELTTRPDMTPPEKLSTVTFGILHAMGHIEKQSHPRDQLPTTNSTASAGRNWNDGTD